MPVFQLSYFRLIKPGLDEYLAETSLGFTDNLVKVLPLHAAWPSYLRSARRGVAGVAAQGQDQQGRERRRNHMRSFLESDSVGVALHCNNIEPSRHATPAIASQCAVRAAACPPMEAENGAHARRRLTRSLADTRRPSAEDSAAETLQERAKGAA